MMDQPLARTPHRESLTQGGESQIAVQTIADGPANDLSREQVDDDSKVQPPLAGPDIGDVHAPFLVRSRGGKILIDDVWCDRPGMIAVSRPFEPPLLPNLQAIFMHQPRRSSSSHGEAAILQLARHPRTAISAVRQCERGSNVCQQHHVIALTPTGWPIFPCKIAALTDAEHSAKTVDGELVFRLIDELELHRLPSLAKKAVAFFRMSRSCRRISFCRRSRFSSAVMSSDRAFSGAPISRSRFRAIQIPSASSSSSPFIQGKLSTFSRQVQSLLVRSLKWVEKISAGVSDHVILAK